MSSPAIPLQASDSTTQGFLTPSSTNSQLVDRNLHRYLQQLVAGLCGLDGTLVRPRWQPEPPDQPVFEATWSAIGLLRVRPDTYAYESHQTVGDVDSDLVVRHEYVDVMVSFYGPEAEQQAERFTMGLQLAQTREYFTRAGYGLVQSDDATVVPYKIGERWLYGLDVQLILKRAVGFTYPVEALAAAEFELVIDQPPITRELTVTEDSL